MSNVNCMTCLGHPRSEIELRLTGRQGVTSEEITENGVTHRAFRTLNKWRPLCAYDDLLSPLSGERSRRLPK